MKKITLIALFLLALANAGYAQTDSLRYKIAQMLIIGFRGMELTPQNHIYSDIKECHIGGVILFDWDAIKKVRERNVRSPQQVKKLCQDLQTLSASTLFVTLDQEGGKVSKLKHKQGFAPTVSARYLGQLDNEDSTRFYAKSCARQLKTLGFNVNFGPCVDIDVNPHCPVIGKVERSFSPKAEVVQKHAAIWIEEHAKQNILTSPKHFPGHGSSTHDSHLGLTDVTDTWTEAELQPYRYLIKNNACNMIMVAHVFNRNIDAEYPATLSRKTIQGLIRQQLQFNGLVITDDMAMGAIVDRYSLEQALEQAILAGADMLILSNNGKTYDPQIAPKAIDIIEKAVRRGAIPQSRIEEAYRRIAQAKSKL